MPRFDLRTVTPDDVATLLTLMDSVHAWLIARAHGAPALALDHWAGSPELGRLYGEHGYVKVSEYTGEQDGKPVRNAVRVRFLGTPG
ncbi:hypothetical protein AB0J42_24590 [Nonomuraea sp. NPDC049649]|uniref:hypothetical protein n=1 Tax=Nonomuraea sp. NPDC049649 TaxID=3155776 RepID=UPI0034345BAE